jgi:predicted dehydrogenase
MKTVIVGLGSIGRRHLRNLRSLGNHEVLLLRTGLSTLPDHELSGLPVVYSLEDALAWKPEAFIIANPTSMHLDFAIPATKAGCHILLEKPISHSLDRVNELREAIEHGGGKILVGFQYRFHPGLQQVKKLLSDKTIGRPLSVRVHWAQWLPGWHPYEDYRKAYSARTDLGGGVILTLCHPLDYLRWLFGDVQKLWAFAGKLNDLEIDVEDTAEIGLMFKNSMLGSVHLDYNGRPPVHNMEIIGTHGTMRWDNASGHVDLYAVDDHINSHTPPGGETPAWELFPAPTGFERNDLFIAEMRHFLEIASEVPFRTFSSDRQSDKRSDLLPVCDLEDGIIALQLTLAALDSARTGQIMNF